MNNEPAVIVSLVAAILGLAASFGLNLSADQTAAIMAVVTIVAGLVIRSKVTPS
jgi:uncharacterized membrane protein